MQDGLAEWICAGSISFFGTTCCCPLHTNTFRNSCSPLLESGLGWRGRLRVEAVLTQNRMSRSYKVRPKAHGLPNASSTVSGTPQIRSISCSRRSLQPLRGLPVAQETQKPIFHFSGFAVSGIPGFLVFPVSRILRFARFGR